MRIAILAVILVLLLGPSLRSGAAASITTTLHPTPAFAGAGGTVQAETQGERTTLTFALHGLAPAAPGRGAVYVAWLADGERRLYNLGTLTPDSAGNAASTFTPPAAPRGDAVLAISVEPRADILVPTAPRDTVVLAGPLAGPVVPQTNQLDADLGPDWFAPIIPATLGLALLRHAARARRAELRARRPAPAPLAPTA